MQKTVLFAFRDDPLCFVHVLLNALDLKAKGFEAGIVLEGAATKLVPLLEDASHFLHPLYIQCREQRLIFGACKACSAKLDALAAVRAAGLPLLDDMNGHPGVAGYQQQGFQVLIF
jgi:hypothetical protein